MPLSIGFRDEENERINNILKMLIGLDYVPEGENKKLETALAEIGLDLKSLIVLEPENVVLHLKQLRFDWANAEQFADFLALLSDKNPARKEFEQQAIAIYNYIQSESKTFSFDISNKIAALKNSR